MATSQVETVRGQRVRKVGRVLLKNGINIFV